MLSKLSQSLSFAAALFVLGINGAQSRDTREMCIAERIELSDAVFIGEAMTLVEPAPKIPGVDRYAVIEVKDVLKGSVPNKISFVINGYSAELNPACCEAGQTYLFFSKLGYDVFELSGGDFATSTLGKHEFLSATNGEFSTFLVQGDEVVGWRGNSSCGEHSSSSKTDVYACIREQIKK